MLPTRTVLAASAAAALVVALAGCSGSTSGSTESGTPASTTAAGAASSTPASDIPATASGTATPQPAEAVAMVDQILVSSAGINFVSSDGDITTIDYFSSVDTAVSALTRAFAGAPQVARVVPEVEPGPSTTYTWPGFVLQDADGEGTAPFDSNFTVTVTAATAGTVALQSADGIVVGSPGAALITDSAGASTPYTAVGESGGTFIWTDSMFPEPDAEHPDGTSSLSVGVSVADDTGTVVRFSAPAPNYGQ